MYLINIFHLLHRFPLYSPVPPRREEGAETDLSFASALSIVRPPPSLRGRRKKGKVKSGARLSARAARRGGGGGNPPSLSLFSACHAGYYTPLPSPRVLKICLLMNQGLSTCQGVRPGWKIAFLLSRNNPKPSTPISSCSCVGLSRCTSGLGMLYDKEWPAELKWLRSCSPKCSGIRLASTGFFS